MSPSIEIIPMSFLSWIPIHKCISFCAKHDNCTMVVLNGTICYLMEHHTCGQPNINTDTLVEVWQQQEIEGKYIYIVHIVDIMECSLYARWGSYF